VALAVRIHAIDNKIDKEIIMIKNNRFTDDTQDERIERLILLSANIGVYGPMIGVPAPKIASAETAYADYLAAIATAGVEDGQMDEAFETLQQAVDALAKYYSRVRAHLQEIIWDFDKPDDFVHGYGFEGKSPTWASGLVSKIEQWKENHDTLVAAGDPRVIPDAVMTELVNQRDNMVSLRAVAHAEKRESAFAYDALQELFALHTRLLRFILTAAQLVWGDEDPRLVELGFQTKSGIWTPGDPPLDWPDWPGPVVASAEQIDEGLVRLTYSGLNGGKTLRIDRLKQGDADYVLVTDGLPLDDPEEVMPFDDNHLDKKKYTYKLTPFDEVGNPGTPALVEVTVR